MRQIDGSVTILSFINRKTMQAEVAERRDGSGTTVVATLWCENASEQERCLAHLNGHRKVQMFVEEGAMPAWARLIAKGNWAAASRMSQRGRALWDQSFVWTGRPGARGFELELLVRESALLRVLIEQLEAASGCDDVFRCLEHLALERVVGRLIPPCVARVAQSTSADGTHRAA